MFSYNWILLIRLLSEKSSITIFIKMRNEDKISVIIITCIRFILQGYKIWREIMIINILENETTTSQKKYEFTYYCFVTACIF